MSTRHLKFGQEFELVKAVPGKSQHVRIISKYPKDEALIRIESGSGHKSFIHVSKLLKYYKAVPGLSLFPQAQKKAGMFSKHLIFGKFNKNENIPRKSGD